jgi:hypothetical protein
VIELNCVLDILSKVLGKILAFLDVVIVRWSLVIGFEVLVGLEEGLSDHDESPSEASVYRRL